MAGKYDSGKASAVKVWIEAVTKRSLSNDLHASLKSGVVLCELINAIWPGSVAKINQGAMPFVQRENVVAYLDAGKKRGLRETDCFVRTHCSSGHAHSRNAAAGTATLSSPLSAVAWTHALCCCPPWCVRVLAPPSLRSSPRDRLPSAPCRSPLLSSALLF